MNSLLCCCLHKRNYQDFVSDFFNLFFNFSTFATSFQYVQEVFFFHNLMRTEVIVSLWAIWPIFMVDRLRAKSVAYQRARKHELFHLISTAAWPWSIAWWCTKRIMCYLTQMDWLSRACSECKLEAERRHGVMVCVSRSTCPMLPGVTEWLDYFLPYKVAHLSCIRLNYL